MTAKEFDFRGYRCPLPVLKARKVLKGIAPGTSVRFLVDDPKAPNDFRDFATITGHRILSATKDAIVIQVS